MSQIQSFISGMGPAGPILTLTGDSGGAVAPNGAGTIFVQGENNSSEDAFAVIEGDLGSNTLSVRASKDEVQTLDAVPVVFPETSFTLDPLESIVMSAHVIGSRDDYAAACGGFITGVARRTAALPAVFVGQSPLMVRDSSTGLPIFGLLLNGNTLSVGVQGVAGEIWNWTCTYQYQKQTMV